MQCCALLVTGCAGSKPGSTPTGHTVTTGPEVVPSRCGLVWHAVQGGEGTPSSSEAPAALPCLLVLTPACAAGGARQVGWPCAPAGTQGRRGFKTPFLFPLHLITLLQEISYSPPDEWDEPAAGSQATARPPAPAVDPKPLEAEAAPRVRPKSKFSSGPPPSNEPLNQQFNHGRGDKPPVASGRTPQAHQQPWIRALAQIEYARRHADGGKVYPTCSRQEMLDRLQDLRPRGGKGVPAPAWR